MLGSLDIPSIGLHSISPAADAHFGEVTDSVFSFRQTFITLLALML